MAAPLAWRWYRSSSQGGAAGKALSMPSSPAASVAASAAYTLHEGSGRRHSMRPATVRTRQVRLLSPTVFHTGDQVVPDALSLLARRL
ncbi:hypothetical protein D9M68_967390 [compost metagenome]